jgi:hypothetical protein
MRSLVRKASAKHCRQWHCALGFEPLPFVAECVPKAPPRQGAFPIRGLKTRLPRAWPPMRHGPFWPCRTRHFASRTQRVVLQHHRATTASHRATSEDVFRNTNLYDTRLRAASKAVFQVFLQIHEYSIASPNRPAEATGKSLENAVFAHRVRWFSQ